MAIIVNTNITALKTQTNLNNATSSLNQALERMSTGYKINKAGDDAAGLYVATGLETQIRGSKVAQDNIATGNNVLQMLEGDLDVILDNLNRIRDLSTQAANSIYGAAAQRAMGDEVQARLEEIDRIATASNFNGLTLLDGNSRLATDGLRLQVGANADQAGNSITISADMFSPLNSDTLGADATGDVGTLTVGTGLAGNVDTVFGDGETAAAASLAARYLVMIDAAIDSISTKRSTIGAMMNRLDAAASSLTTTIENNTAAKSTIMDADIAEESAEYTKQQILQQTSSALLVQANALPQIAIQLVQG